MKDNSRISTAKFHMPPCYLRVPSSPEGRYSLPLLPSEDVFFGDETSVQKTVPMREESEKQLNRTYEAEGQEDKETCGSVGDALKIKIKEAQQGEISLLTRREFLEDTHLVNVHRSPSENDGGGAAEDNQVDEYNVLNPLLIHDLPRTSRCDALTREPTSTPCTTATPSKRTREDSYSLFYEDEEAMATALEATDADVNQSAVTTPSSLASQIQAAQMFSCVAAQTAPPPSSPPEQKPEQHRGGPERQQQEPVQQLADEAEEELPNQAVSHARQKISWSPDTEIRAGGPPRGGSRRTRGGGFRRQPLLRSYSMLDIENDAFTGVHENDVESEAGQCLRNMKIICGFCLLCFGVFLLLTCPKMRKNSPLIFYYILCTMLAELGIALCFGCSICMLACLVGEQGAVYANATCGLLHRVVEGIAHYTFTGLGGYLLYKFKALEGVWYASGEKEQEKFLYLLIYVGCEATISLLYSLQTLRTLFGVCRFIVTKVYAKITGRGDVFFLHGDAPVIYASMDQYRRALRRMRNPVDVAFLRRHPQHHRGPGHHLSIYGNSTDEEMYDV